VAFVFVLHVIVEADAMLPVEVVHVVIEADAVLPLK
jgi:hypothetical protein